MGGKTIVDPQDLHLAYDFRFKTIELDDKIVNLEIFDLNSNRMFNKGQVSYSRLI